MMMNNRRNKKKENPHERYKIPDCAWDLICKYCENRNGENRRYCAAEVPWYFITWYCKFFLEVPLEPEPKRKKSDISEMRKIMKKSLVDTL